MDRPDFLKRVAQHIKNTNTPKVKAMLEQFLDQCTYVAGPYDQDSGFLALEQEVQRVEREAKTHDRLFYMALPPSVFIPVANGLKKNCYTTRGVNRLIVEKPFGMDLESSRTLSKALGALYREDEVRRRVEFVYEEKEGTDTLRHICTRFTLVPSFLFCWERPFPCQLAGSHRWRLDVAVSIVARRSEKKGRLSSETSCEHIP